MFGLLQYCSFGAQEDKEDPVLDLNGPSCKEIVYANERSRTVRDLSLKLLVVPAVVGMSDHMKKKTEDGCTWPPLRFGLWMDRADWALLHGWMDRVDRACTTFCTG
jgi:hypothetical protein